MRWRWRRRSLPSSFERRRKETSERKRPKEPSSVQLSTPHQHQSCFTCHYLALPIVYKLFHRLGSRARPDFRLRRGRGRSRAEQGQRRSLFVLYRRIKVSSAITTLRHPEQSSFPSLCSRPARRSITASNRHQGDLGVILDGHILTDMLEPPTPNHLIGSMPLDELDTGALDELAEALEVLCSNGIDVLACESRASAVPENGERRRSNYIRILRTISC